MYVFEELSCHGELHMVSLSSYLGGGTDPLIRCVVVSICGEYDFVSFYGRGIMKLTLYRVN